VVCGTEPKPWGCVLVGSDDSRPRIKRVGIPTLPSVENQEAMVLPANGCSEDCIIELGKTEGNGRVLLVELNA